MYTYNNLSESTVSGVAIGNVEVNNVMQDNAITNELIVADCKFKFDQVNILTFTFSIPNLTLMKLLMSLLIRALRSAFFSLPL